MELKIYVGKILSKNERVGTKSKGPEYSIILDEPNEFGQIELFIRKEVHLWQEVPVLQKCVGKRVELEEEPIYTKYVKFEGAVKSEGIIYKKIKTIS
ncbi:MAG: hypothetical protein ACFFDH_16810 [Promethearchaeota archaeon]